MRTTRDAYSLGAAGLGEAGALAGGIKTTNAIHYVINGRAYIKAATDNVAPVADASSAFVNLAANQAAVFFVFADTAGTLTVVQSPVFAGSKAAGYVSRGVDWPEVANKACIGAYKVETQNAATYVPGTTDMSAADVIDTYFSVADDYGVPVII